MSSIAYSGTGCFPVAKRAVRLRRITGYDLFRLWDMPDVAYRVIRCRFWASVVRTIERPGRRVAASG